MIDNKKITFEAINHFVEWSQFSRNTKEEINKSLQLYLNQKQYKGLMQLKIDRNVNLSEEKLEFRNKYKSLINDFDLKVIHTPVFEFLTVRSHNCLRNAKYFFKKQFEEVTLKELIDVAGMKDKNTRQESLTLFQGFSQEQLDAIGKHDTKKIAGFKRETE